MRIPINTILAAENMSKELHIPFTDALDILMRVGTEKVEVRTFSAPRVLVLT